MRRRGGPAPTSPGGRRIRTRTLRTDRWWLQPLITISVLGVFVAYTGVRIFMRDYYWSEENHYLTPLFSPCLSESCVPGSSHFGTPLPELPIFIPLPFLIFPILAGFRATCYYYRKAYYRSAWLSPPACAVARAAQPLQRRDAASPAGAERAPLLLHAWPACSC